MVFLGRKHRGSTCYYITSIMTRTESEPLKPKESKAKALTPSMRSCFNPFRTFPHLLTAKLTTPLALDFLKKNGPYGSRRERRVLSSFVVHFVKNWNLHFTCSKSLEMITVMLVVHISPRPPYHSIKHTFY